MTFQDLPPIDEFRKILRYDHQSGFFFWKLRPEKFGFWNAKYANKKAGGKDAEGYIKIKAHGKKVSAHRMAWAFVYGDWPKSEIDHINQDRSDNRISNLRMNVGSGNWRNTKRCGGSSKFRGVYKAKGVGKWGSRIKVNGKTKHLGTFDNEKDAAMAYDAAAKKLHGAFCSTNARLGLY